MAKKYYHYCVDVFVYNEEIQQYELWFKESFSSKKNYEIWADGFNHGNDQTKHPIRRKLGEPYVKYREYKPKF